MNITELTSLGFGSAAPFFGPAAPVVSGFGGLIGGIGNLFRKPETPEEKFQVWAYPLYLEKAQKTGLPIYVEWNNGNVYRILSSGMVEIPYNTLSLKEDWRELAKKESDFYEVIYKESQNRFDTPYLGIYKFQSKQINVFTNIDILIPAGIILLIIIVSLMKGK